ncbi:substrate-binding domain-containing protein [Pleomorphochaeta sp. DL1XJH-081]|uniref:substrate-binding domain-containing protein n=1 Tax=Pleomorphochaeta sp. DL1XJH-081 TaxID=3409690 RepID=UPI003BB575A7
MPIIGISLRFQDSFDSQVARGIIEYAKAKNDWSLRGSGGGLRPLKYTGRDRCDAVIARIESAQDADRYASLGIPVVDIAGAHTRHEIHRVQNDDFATGRRAGEYLRRLGARSFAYCGVQKVHWSRQRLLGFTEAAGISVDTMPRFERSLPWWQQSTPSPALRSWLRQLPEPTAIFCCNDIAGVKAIAHASDIALDIPSRLTLLGVDDEDLLCTLCNPSLSSVRLDCATIGFRGAALIDTMLESAPMRIPNQPHIVLVPPQEVVERESTTVVLEKDPVVAQAVRYIRTNFSKAITVEDVVHHCSVSRRNLEIRFKQARGMTIHAEIAQMRLIQACKLLKQTDLTIETIASECAFPNVQRFHVLFKRAFGSTPGNWRLR